MEPLTSTFNGSEPNAGTESGSQGETASGGGPQPSSDRSIETAAPTTSNDNPTAEIAAPTSSSVHETQDSAPDPEPIDPATQALNDAQDRRHAEDAHISDQNMQARRRLEADLDRRYGANIRQLQREIGKLQGVLDNSGLLRLTWLKLTGQISKYPQRDLHTLQATLEMNERYQSDAQQAFEDRIQKEKEAREVNERNQEKNTKQEQQTDASGSQRYANLTCEQALERLESLESNRTTPEPEPHLRPGGSLQLAVDAKVAAQHEAEISSLRTSLAPDQGSSRGPGTPALTPYSEIEISL